MNALCLLALTTSLPTATALDVRYIDDIEKENTAPSMLTFFFLLFFAVVLALYLEKLCRYLPDYALTHLRLRLRRRWKVKEEEPDEATPMDVDAWEPTKTEDDYEAEIRSLKKKLRKLMEDKEDLMVTIQVKEDCISSLQDEIKEKNMENMSGQDFRERQERQIDKLDVEKTDAERARDRALDEMDRITFELANTQKELVKRENELEKVRGRFDRLEEKHSKLVDDHESIVKQ